jgi:hypothetical protein
MGPSIGLVSFAAPGLLLSTLKMHEPLDTDTRGTNPLQQSADRYDNELAIFQNAVMDALWTSDQAKGLSVDPRLYWVSVLFTRICCISESVLALCPDRLDPFSTTHWDFASVASLTRNLLEATAFFYYFSEPVDDDEWAVRLLVMQLNDRTQRRRFFVSLREAREIGQLDEEIAGFRIRLSNAFFFKALPLKLQKDLLEGHRPSVSTLREMVRLFQADDQIWPLYDFLSFQSHTLPMSFYRAAEQGRTGIENMHDRAYIAGLLPVATSILLRATGAFKTRFSKLVEFKPEPTGGGTLLIRNIAGKEDSITDVKRVPEGIQFTALRRIPLKARTSTQHDGDLEADDK